MKDHSILLEQKTAVEQIRRKYGNESASHAFQSLYIWQKDMKLELFLEEDLFAVKTGIYGENAWFFPCGSREKTKAFLESHRKEPDFFLCYLREEDRRQIQSWFPEDFEFWLEPAESEYLYLRREQEEMPGGKFSKLRNHWKRALREHELEVIPLDDRTMDSAAEILGTWELTHPQPGMLGLRDEEASFCLLRNWKELDVHGILLFVDGEPYAMAAGYPLGDTVFDLCMAKQKGKLPGVSVYAKWAFYKSLPSEIQWINAEEDMGIEGLRTLKRQMQPAGMIEMYNGRVRIQ